MTEPSTNDTDHAVTAKKPIISNYGLVLTVYILYLVGFLTGITVLGRFAMLTAIRRALSPVTFASPLASARIWLIG